MSITAKYSGPLEFSFGNRHYSIPFLGTPVMQLKGDTAVGKSLFVNDFRALMATDRAYANSLVVDIENRAGLKTIRTENYDYVIIDNADLLITPEIDDFIYDYTVSFPKTRYIIIGRKTFICVGTPLGVGSLIQKWDDITGDYYFTVDIAHTA